MVYFLDTPVDLGRSSKGVWMSDEPTRGSVVELKETQKEVILLLGVRILGRIPRSQDLAGTQVPVGE